MARYQVIEVRKQEAVLLDLDSDYSLLSLMVLMRENVRRYEQRAPVRVRALVSVNTKP